MQISFIFTNCWMYFDVQFEQFDFSKLHVYAFPFTFSLGVDTITKRQIRKRESQLLDIDPGSRREVYNRQDFSETAHLSETWLYRSVHVGSLASQHRESVPQLGHTGGDVSGGSGCVFFIGRNLICAKLDFSQSYISTFH